MSTSQFHMLLDLIGPNIEKLDTNWRRSISPAERLAITLRSVLIKISGVISAKPWVDPSLPISSLPSLPLPLRNKPAIINIHGSRALHNEGSSAPRCVAHSHCAQYGAVVRCILLLYSLPERIERNMSRSTARHCFLCEYCS